MPDAVALTPMFRQYRALKAEHPGTILFFRMGDFYEMFDEDARTASPLLSLTLTARGKGTAHAAPMCGFPWHQLDAYAARLARAGLRVAVCDQVEDPKVAKGLVKRDVVRIITPGTLDDPDEDGARRANAWIAGVARVGGSTGAAFLDTGTGELAAWEAAGDGAEDRLVERLAVFEPREIVHAEGDAAPALHGPAVTAADPFTFQPRAALDLLKRHFQVESLDGFGLAGKTAAIAAAGGLLAYVRDTTKSDLEHVDALHLHDPARHLRLDPASFRSLEVDRGLRDGGRDGSLLHAIDRTLTAAGARALRAWLAAPLLDRAEIARRHDAVEEAVARGRLRDGVRGLLKGTLDVERLLARAVSATAGAADLIGIRDWLARLPALAAELSGARAELLAGVAACDPCADVHARLAASLHDDPPAGLREGGLMRDGVNPELDELRAIRRDGRATIAAIETREREATGIASLKVRFNKVFGYYIEVSRSNLHLVPETYQRKQTIAGGERFVTAELKDFEEKVLSAQERIETLEHDLFVALRAEVARAAPRVKAAARSVATLDALTGLAEIAVERDYRRPSLVDEPVLLVTAGRHPVVEGSLVESRFTPNDARLSGDDGRLAILTGPNMGGKSTFLRQNALIVLLAQAGSFVPAEEATVGIADRIFCRVGASDNLAEGQSTFMVEMAETANILRHATARSLVLLDEIGRGTSTFDGLAIAWSVAESLAGSPGGTPRTLFATHYHELTELAVTQTGVVNLRMAVREWGERVVFTHHVEAGAADRSYGIHVARLAGVPRAVVARAAEILANLERDEYERDGTPRRARRANRQAADRPGERPLFSPAAASAPGPPPEAALLAEILDQDPERLTPLEALALVDRWKRRLTEAGRKG
jgi:DNA mismatch repair protein MutS